ncbi:hypothetical protein SCLCIDRAFT_30052 [Scleroderma citrinum Foug A]|uniref:Uncharacterized protein n=1 Tax=Scleroderma citrinum Foug A TaxID=1036808 RepID=A0A0C3D4R8_9AGAM|nr:hypothetical protein SCLCIDRAFT_30052 [Scleroderma citrinum Foug A]
MAVIDFQWVLPHFDSRQELVLHFEVNPRHPRPPAPNAQPYNFPSPLPPGSAGAPSFWGQLPSS